MERRNLPAKMTRGKGLVDSKSFPFYLLNIRNYHSTDQEFARSLYLPYFKRGIDELYDLKVKGPMNIGSETISRILGDDLALFSKGVMEKEDDIERGRLFFLEKNTLDLGMTKPVVGDFESVRALTGLDEVLLSGNIPLMDVHTHPSDSPFSAPDYTAILTDLYPSIPFVNASMVLCPNLQLLALRTHQTPLYDIESAKLITDEEKRRNILDENLKLRSLQKEFFRSKEVVHTRRPTKLISYFEQRADILLDGMMNEGQTEEDMRLVADGLSSRFSKAINKYGEILLTWMKRSSSEYIDLHGQISNSKLMDFPRRLHLQMYFSTDRTNFKKVSA